MQVQDLYDEMLAAILIVAGLMAARPVLSWLLMKFYELFIGTNHL
jgi:hypothetical protein